MKASISSTPRCRAASIRRRDTRPTRWWPSIDAARSRLSPPAPPPAISEDEASQSSRQRETRLGQRLDGLTSREREILEQVVAGRSNKEVGRTLGISYKTVEAHRGRLMRKMGAASFAELLQMMLTRA